MYICICICICMCIYIYIYIYMCVCDVVGGGGADGFAYGFVRRVWPPAPHEILLQVRVIP